MTGFGFATLKFIYLVFKGRTIIFLPGGSHFGKAAHNFLAIQQFQTSFLSFYSCEQFFKFYTTKKFVMMIIFLNKNIYEFLHKKILFMLLLKIILRYFDNYTTHFEGENDF